MEWLYIIFIGFFLIMWLVVGFYISFANTAIGKVRNDNDSNAAYDWSLAAEIITWVIFSIGVAGGIILAIAFFAGGDVLLGGELLLTAGSQGKLIKGITIAVLVIISFLLFVTGVCAAKSAMDLNNSPSFDPTNENYNKGYKYSVIAAVLSFVSLALLPFILLTMHIFRKEKIKKNKRELQDRIAYANQLKAKTQ